MTPTQYTEVILVRDEPEANLMRGDIAMFVDTVPHPQSGEEGAVLELFNVLGESVRVAIVPISAIAPLSADLMPTARQTEFQGNESQ